MANQLPKQQALTYLITSGQTTELTTPTSDDFSSLLNLISSAVNAEIDLIQIREKQLPARVLFELASSAARITRGSQTKLLVNDRADIATAAGADGVHLTTTSLPARVVRSVFGDQFLIGVSTHSHIEVNAARAGGADFVVFGPVFQSISKPGYGNAKGVQALSEVASEVSPFPVIALGGINAVNVSSCIAAGARGVAAISMFQDTKNLAELVRSIRVPLS
jgi:thiamine-phosphate pyrophosphorylase